VIDRAPLLERAARSSVVLWLLGRVSWVRVTAAAVASDARDPDVARVYVRDLRTLTTLAVRIDRY
jgi:type IV secretory pathway TrbD component